MMQDAAVKALRDAVETRSQELIAEATGLRVDARAGFVQFPDDGDHAEALLQEAKVAVQHPKDAGAAHKACAGGTRSE